MKWFQNLAFRFQLIVPLGLIAALFILFAWTTWRQINVLGFEAHTLIHADVPVVVDLLQADRDVYQALVAERTLLFLDVNSTNYQDLVRQHSENLQQARERMAEVAQTVAVSHLAQIEIDSKIKEFENKYARWTALSQQVVDARSTDTRAGRSMAIGLTLHEGRVAFDEARTVLNQLEETVITIALSAAGRTEEAVATSQTQTVTLLSVGLVALVVVMLTLPPLILRPLRQIVERVHDITEGEGDLTARLKEELTNEIGQLARMFNRFLAHLQEVIRQTVVTGQQLDDAAHSLSQVAKESDALVVEQFSQIQMVAEAMHEMTVTVAAVANNTAEAASSAQVADDGVRDGVRVVTEAAVAIQKLADTVAQATTAITALESETNRIGAVLEVIKSIAEQTSLLALNAAIEAARAGESGRGFAVVAAEVRNLASRTQQSTGEIEAMIAALQTRTRTVVGVMQNGGGLAEMTLQKSARTSQSLAEIANAVARINEMNTQIATATDQQIAVTEEINRNTARIQSLTNQATVANHNTVQARMNLVTLAHTLRGGLARFKV